VVRPVDILVLVLHSCVYYSTIYCVGQPGLINMCMKVWEIIGEKASKDLCTSDRSDKSLGASNLSSCRSQGYRPRRSSVKHTIKKVRQSIDGKKIKGKKYGGPLPDWS